MIGLLFAVFGFAAWVNSILVPYFQITLELNMVQTTLVTFSFFIAYVVMAIPSSWILKRIGFKKGIVMGLLIMAVGTVMFVPAAGLHAYWFFLIALFVLGTGQAILQTAANPYITILGPIESAARRNSFMGVCNKIAGIASQRLLGPLLLLNADLVLSKLKTMTPGEKEITLTEMSHRIINPYWTMTAVLGIISVIMWAIPLPDVNDEEDNPETGVESKSSIWMFPNLILGVLALFCAEGLESITSYYIIPFGQMMGFSTAQSQPFVDYIIYSMLAGYLVGMIMIPRRITQERALAFCAATGSVLAVVSILSGGAVAVACMVLMGFCNALNWPSIWPLAIQGLGRFTKTAAAFLIMAIAGDAVLPVLFAQLNASFGVRAGLTMMLLQYGVIFYYAVNGHKRKKWKLNLA